MSILSFDQACKELALFLKIELPSESLEEGVRISLNEIKMEVHPGKLEGSFRIEMALGVFEDHPSIEQQKELIHANFLGINTAGARFLIDSDGALLFTQELPPGTSSNDLYEALLRQASMVQEWQRILSTWQGILLLTPEKAAKR